MSLSQHDPANLGQSAVSEGKYTVCREMTVFICLAQKSVSGINLLESGRAHFISEVFKVVLK